MRKVFIFVLAAGVLISFTAANAYEGCGATKKVTHSGCPSQKTVDKGTAGGEHGKACPESGACEFATLAVEGMTCGNCEQSVTEALSGVDGVVKVLRVSYNEGIAEVCYNSKKTDSQALVTAIENKGYPAKVITMAEPEKKNTACATVTKIKPACCRGDKKASSHEKSDKK